MCYHPPLVVAWSSFGPFYAIVKPASPALLAPRTSAYNCALLDDICRGGCHFTWPNHISLFLLIVGIERRGSLCAHLRLDEVAYMFFLVDLWNSFHRNLISNVCTLQPPFLTLSAMSMANIILQSIIGTTSDLICYLTVGSKAYVALPYSVKSGMCCIGRWNLDADFSWACPHPTIGLLICLWSFNKELVDRQCHKPMGCLGWHPVGWCFWIILI